MLISEFYITHWEQIKDEFFLLVNDTFEKKELTPSQYKGVLTLLHKSPYYKYTFYSPSRHIKNVGGRRGHNRTLVTLTSTYAINTLKNIYETSKDNVICLFPNLIVTYSCF
jgi:hypothetical protein